jgi:hypothetical protein
MNGSPAPFLRFFLFFKKNKDFLKIQAGACRFLTSETTIKSGVKDFLKSLCF